MAAKKTLSDAEYPNDLPRRGVRRFHVWMDGFEPAAKDHAARRESISTQDGRSDSRKGRSPSRR